MKYFVLALVALFAVPQTVFGGTCDPCEKLAAEIRIGLMAWDRYLESPEGAPPFWTMTPVAPGAPEAKSLFLQRLESYERYRASRARLDKLEANLLKLEAELDKEQNPHLAQVVENQRLLVEELRFQLDEIYKKFQQLDQLIDAHEQRIDAIQGGLKGAKEEIKILAASIHSHNVASTPFAYDSIQEYFGRKELGLGDIWVFPRTEFRYEDARYTTAQTTVGVEGSLFGIIQGEAKGGLVFDTRLSLEVFALSPGLSPLLTSTGASTRDSGMFCGVSRTHTYRGFGSAGGSASLDLKLVKLSTGGSLEVGAVFSGSSKRYSDLFQFRQGETFQSQIEKCRKFMQQVRRDSFDEELAGQFKLVQFPETTCTKDYDCRKEVSLGALLPSTVSQCVTAQNRQYATCLHRSVDGGISCILPSESSYKFRYPCATGYSCSLKTRRCEKETTQAARLAKVGLKEAKVVSLGASYYDAVDKVLCPTGWSLPTVDQLPAVGQWFREHLRETTRARNPRASAQSWYYPAQGFRDMLWSDGPWVYLMSNDSVTRYDLNDPNNARKFRDPETGKPVTHGIALCVR